MTGLWPSPSTASRTLLLSPGWSPVGKGMQNFTAPVAVTRRRALLHLVVQWGPRTELNNGARSNGLWFRLDTARHSGRRLQAVIVTSYLPDKSH